VDGAGHVPDDGEGSREDQEQEAMPAVPDPNYHIALKKEMHGRKPSLEIVSVDQLNQQGKRLKTFLETPITVEPTYEVDDKGNTRETGGVLCLRIDTFLVNVPKTLEEAFEMFIPATGGKSARLESGPRDSEEVPEKEEEAIRCFHAGTIDECSGCGHVQSHTKGDCKYFTENKEGCQNQDCRPYEPPR